MSKPEQLRRITDNTLYGLVADDALKHRILRKAAEQDHVYTGRHFHAVPALCTVLAVLLIAVLALNTLKPVSSSGPGEIIAFTAGNTHSQSASVFPSGFNPATVAAVSFDGITIADPQQCSFLCSLLLDKTESAGSVMEFSQNRLVISSMDGTAYTFDTDEPYIISPDGRSWKCTSFFNEFGKLNQ